MQDQSQPTLGETLRRARGERGLPLAAIAAQLRIKEHFLKALEGGQFDQMPSPAHGKGFLRSYAQYIGLSAQLADLQDQYTREASGVVDEPHLSMPQPLPEGKLPSLRVIAGALCAAVLLYIIWYSLNDVPPAAVEPPPVASTQPTRTPETPVAISSPPEMTPIPAEPVAASVPAEPEPLPVPVVEPLPEPAVEAPVPPRRLIVRAVQPAWVEVKVGGGATVFSKLMQPGEEYKVPDQPSLWLMTGNGAGVVLVTDGKAGKVLGRPAQVLRNVMLTPSPLGKVPPAKVTPAVKKPQASQPAATPKPQIQVQPPAAITPRETVPTPPSKGTVAEPGPYDYDAYD